MVSFLYYGLIFCIKTVVENCSFIFYNKTLIRNYGFIFVLKS